MNKNILCVDIGGTHISSAVIDYDTLAIIDNSYLTDTVDSHADRDTILSQWLALLKRSLQQSKLMVMYMIVSIPGPFDYNRGISLMDGMHKYQALLHVDIKSFFANNLALEKDHIYFINDAQAFLLGEVFHHQLHQDKVIGLTLGTGLGSAFYVHNEVRDLNLGSAQFAQGISEDYISTRGLLSKLNSISTAKVDNIKDLVTSDDLEQEKLEVFSYLVEMLNAFITQHIVPLAPQYLVIGGSIAKSHQLFFNQLQESVTIPLKIASFDECNLFKGLANTIK